MALPTESSEDPSQPERKPFNPWNPDNIGEEEKPSFIETPFTIRQVETHLIFGPISRHVPFAAIAFVLFAILMIVAFVLSFNERGSHPNIGPALLAGGAFAALGRASLRRQAIVGWAMVKLAL